MRSRNQFFSILEFAGWLFGHHFGCVFERDSKASRLKSSPSPSAQDDRSPAGFVSLCRESRHEFGHDLVNIGNVAFATDDQRRRANLLQTSAAGGLVRRIAADCSTSTGHSRSRVALACRGARDSPSRRSRRPYFPAKARRLFRQLSARGALSLNKNPPDRDRPAGANGRFQDEVTSFFETGLLAAALASNRSIYRSKLSIAGGPSG